MLSISSQFPTFENVKTIIIRHCTFRMLTSRTFLLFAIQSLLLAVVRSYKIDKSCTDEGIEQNVRDAMTSAFEMVDAAMSRLTATNWDQDTSDLIANLFAREGETARDVQTAKLTSVFENIRTNYRTEATNGNEVGIDDLVSDSQH